MGKFRVLIVDDELNIAEGLRFLITRMVLDCEVAAVAHDGQQGYEQALKQKPDIILTDIQMPVSDGIEMMQRLRGEASRARFIILSGYAEFEYAQNAISLGADGYIIKPVEEEELCAVFGKVCASLREEQRQREQLLDMQHRVNEYGLLDILTASGERDNDIRSRLGQLGFPLESKGYSCSVWEAGDIEGDREAFCETLRKQADKFLNIDGKKTILPSSRHQIVMIVSFNEEYEKSRYNTEVGRLRFILGQQLGTVINVGVGMLYPRAERIRESFEEARCSLNYKVVKVAGTVIHYEEIRNITSNQKLADVEDVRRLEACIDSMNDSGCRQAVTAIFNKIEARGDISLTDLQVLSLNLVLIGIRKIPFMQFQLNSYLGMNILSLESIARFQTIEQLRNWIINMLKSMNELMLRENMPERRDIVEEIKEYMHKNYNREVSLNHISEKYFINANYLSQLFKKKTGETYQNYLTGIRIGRAKRLLEETDLKLYEICAMIGYTDANYFNKVFERRVGVKPGDYRNSYLVRD